MDIARQDAQLELLARMLQEQRSGALGPLEDYLKAFPEDTSWVAHHYQRLVGADDEARDSGWELGEGSLLGPYRLDKELGRGGQGAVWRAVDERLERPVALKLLPVVPGSQDAGPRFRREARLAASLDHPSLCTVYEAGSTGSISWIAMQLVEGQTLAASESAEGTDGVRGAAALEANLIRFQGLAEALAIVHGAGIVHRDVKPANIMLTPEGRFVLLDFGVARNDDDGAPITLSGHTVGTPAYMSPEQLSGRGTVDGRSDVWSLGVTLYEALAGRRPFDAPTREGVVRQVLDSDPGPMGQGLPRDLEVLVSVALAKDPVRRYAGAAELAEELARVRRGEPILARPMRIHERVWSWARREPRFAASILGFGLALIAALLALALALDDTRSALRERNELLGEVGRTSDQVLVADLLEQAPMLWPALPTKLGDLKSWRQQALGVLSRQEEHRQRRDRVAERVASAGLASLADGNEDERRDAWLLVQLEDLLTSLQGIDVPLASVEARITFASEVHRLTVAEYADSWASAVARVAADTRFAGFTLTAQVGLIPLGPDPTTGLEEFAHLATGAAPARRPEDGSLIRGPEHGVVLVLVPGGEAELGCLALAEGRQQGDAYVDVGARPCDLGLLPASFEPFLLSKYELTQSQWARHEGSNPAYYQFGDESVPPMRPIEQISWVDCVRVLGELDLALPTEDQWEYAARAGTTSSWPFGDERAAAALHCNLSDSVAKATWKNPQFGYEEWMDDGFADPAPVGSYLPNAFGLHDVIGNVKEWTSSPWSWPEEKFVKRKDDRDPATCATRVTRGGSFGTTMVFARVAGRSGYAPSVGSYQVGVRPMRALRAPD